MKMNLLYGWMAMFLVIGVNGVLCSEGFLDDDPEVIAEIAAIEKKIDKKYAEIPQLKSEKKFQDVLANYYDIQNIGFNFYTPEQFQSANLKARVSSIHKRIAQATEAIKNTYLDDDPEVMKEIAQDQQKIDDLNQKIAALEAQKKGLEALPLYGEIGNMFIDASEQFQNPKTKKQLDAMRERVLFATEVIRKEAEKLEKADKTEEALKVYWLMPQKFAQKIWKYNVPTINDYYAKAQSSEAQGRTQEALEWYGKASKELAAIFFKENYIIPTNVSEDDEEEGEEEEPEEEIPVLPFNEIAIYEQEGPEFGYLGFSPEQAAFVEKMRNGARDKITELYGVLMPPQLQKARDLAKQGKYAEAYAILNPFKVLGIQAALDLEAEIRKQEGRPAKSKEPQWIVLRKAAPGEKIIPSDAHIENGNLEFNKNAEQPINFLEGETFAEVANKARQEKKPFILVGLRGKDMKTGEIGYSFFDHSIIEHLQNSEWAADPYANKRVPDRAEIYVASDDGKFDFLSLILTQANMKDSMFAKLAAPDTQTYNVIADIFKKDAKAKPQAQKWSALAAKYAAAPAPAAGDLVQALNSLTAALTQVSANLK